MKSQRPKRKKVVILTPVFNEEANLLGYKQAVTEILFPRNDVEFRVIFIDDGSSDGSWKMIQSICEKDIRFSAIRLSRNFGSHIALSAGIDHANGDAVAILACDLQDPPETIVDFVQKWQDGAQIVWGRRATREDDKWKIFSGILFNKLLRKFVMPKGSLFTTGSFLLFDKKVVEAYRQFKDQGRLTFALVAWTGFDQAVVDYNRKARIAGKSGWTLSRMLVSIIDAILGYSVLPVRIITTLGICLFVLGIGITCYAAISKWYGTPMTGWTSIFMSLTFFFALQFFILGLIGEYLYRIYKQSLARPLYFVSDEKGKRL